MSDPITLPLSPAQVAARLGAVQASELAAVRVAQDPIGQPTGAALALALNPGQAQLALGMRPPTRNPFAF